MAIAFSNLQDQPAALATDDTAPANLEIDAVIPPPLNNTCNARRAAHQQAEMIIIIILMTMVVVMAMVVIITTHLHLHLHL